MKDEIRDRLGFYLVGWKKFFNKTLALIESKKTGYDLKWVFNDTVYSNMDWSKEIETSLFDLYKKRALQLREKYDYLILHFSGGADSANILYTFITNNIFLDEIVMEFPEPAKQRFNSSDLTMANHYSEIEYAAIPFLDKFKNKIHRNTKIRYQDFAKPTIEFLTKDNWFEDLPLGTNITLSGVGRQIAHLNNNHVRDICYKGKFVAQILGIDKPNVHYDGKDFYAYFIDLSAMHSPPASLDHSDLFDNNFITEFFYWTPDMPEILVKQAQDLKKFYLINEHARWMSSQSLKKHIKEFRPILHPIIYPTEVEPSYQTETPNGKIIRTTDNWFWATADNKAQQNYLETINYLGKNANSKYMVNNDVRNGFSASYSKFYKI